MRRKTEQYGILQDRIYVFVKSTVKRLESSINAPVPERIISQIAHDLKVLHRNTGMYGSSVTAVIALLYYYKVVDYKTALALLRQYGKWKSRFRDVLRLVSSMQRRRDDGKEEDVKRSSRRVICPVCGEPGYLSRNRVKGHVYLRVVHYDGVGNRTCHLGRADKVDISKLYY